MYRDGRYAEALSHYTDALSMAKTKAQKIALHSNRAACFLKLHDFKKAADECTSVLELDQKHTGALMLRAQTLVTLKEYQSALFDVNRLLEVNPSSEVYLNLQARLKTQLSLAPIPEAESESEEADEDTSEETTERDQGLENLGEEQKDDASSGSVQKDGHDTNLSNGFFAPQPTDNQQSSDPHSKGWEAIPKPQGHSRLDYSRWDRVADGSSEEDDDDDDDHSEDEENQPRYMFRVKTVDLRPFK